MSSARPRDEADVRPNLGSMEGMLGAMLGAMLAQMSGMDGPDSPFMGFSNSTM